eukprot:10213549-Karenia_brevis.AAC.1
MDKIVRNWQFHEYDDAWEELTAEEGERVFAQGGSLSVFGIAGTGKTTLCRKLVDAAKAAGKRV